jgi:hypothetical protein
MALILRGGPVPGQAASLCAVATVLALLSPLAARAQAQAPVDAGSVSYTKASVARVANALRASVLPAIDGKLDDAAWESASPITDFVQHEPSEGAAPSETTDVRILYDDRALYVGVRLLDRNAGEIVVGEKRRDASLNDTDSFVILLDTYHDRHSAFVFGTTPAGIEVDGQIASESGGVAMNWNGSWQVATSMDGAGWYAEFRIPFSTLRYKEGEKPTWGLNFARRIRRHNEEVYWSAVPRNFDLYRVSLAGTLTGLELPRQKLLNVTPYVLAAARRDYTIADKFGYPVEFGGDAKIGLTPSLALDLTYNTDFAQVEVDEQQINLTRFAINFPEKRPFFLENSGLFTVGWGGNSELFSSRRIGIASNGTQVPLLGGGRVTGKLAGVNVGVLDIQTRTVENLQPATNFGVIRLAKDLPNRSRVGGIFINKSETGGSADYNRTYGVDGRLGVGDALSMQGFAAATQSPEKAGREYAFRAFGEYSTRTWKNSFGVASISDDFNPEVGFLQRSGYRYVEAGVYRLIRIPTLSWLREWRPHFNYRGHWDFVGFQESGWIHIDNDIDLANGGVLSFGRNWSLEGSKEDFTINGIPVAAGTYNTAVWEGSGHTDMSAPIALNAGFTIGSFYSGTRRGGNLTLSGKRGGTIAGSLRVRYDQIDLAEGSFDATLVTARIAYNFTPRIYLQSLIQYSDQTDAISGNVRLGWLSTAGTGLFLVLNETQSTLDEEERFLRPDLAYRGGILSRGVILKFTKQLDISR